MSTEDEVRQASDQFYAALNRLTQGELAPMLAVWSQAEAVTALHPPGGRAMGRAAVRATWEGLSQSSTHGQVSVSDLLVRCQGDLAYTVGVERGEGVIPFTARSTNIYRREEGAWKMIHHHVDLVPAVQEALARARAERG